MVPKWVLAASLVQLAQASGDGLAEPIRNPVASTEVVDCDDGSISSVGGEAGLLGEAGARRACPLRAVQADDVDVDDVDAGAEEEPAEEDDAAEAVEDDDTDSTHLTITQQADGDLHIHHTDDDGDTFSLVVDVDGDEADAADDEEAAAEDDEQDVEEEGPHDESREAIKLILQEEDETKIAMDEAKSPIQTKIEQLQHQLHAAQQESIEASREQELARTTLLAALDAGKEDAQRVYDNADRNAKQAAELVQYHSDEIETQRKELAELERKQILDAKEKLASVSVDEATGQVTSAAPAHPSADKPLTQKMKEQLARFHIIKQHEDDDDYELTAVSILTAAICLVLVAAMFSFCFFCFRRQDCLCFSKPFRAAKDTARWIENPNSVGPMMPYAAPPPPMYPPRVPQHSWPRPYPSYGYYPASAPAFYARDERSAAPRYGYSYRGEAPPGPPRHAYTAPPTFGNSYSVALRPGERLERRPISNGSM